MSVKMLGRIFCVVKVFMLRLKFGKRLEIKPGRQIIRADTEITIGKDARLSIDSINVNTNVHLECKRGEMKLGRGVILNRNCIIACRHKITIGDNCLFGPNVCIYDHDHLYDSNGVSPDKFKCSEIIIEDSCWIGANAVILRGTHIGKNSVIGAGIVVNGSIPSNSLVLSVKETRAIPINFFTTKCK